MLDVVEGLGRIQVDPTNAVARTDRLVLWSRLGDHDTTELDRLLARRKLFEYWAYIVPVRDFAIHRETMRRYLRGQNTRARYVREWLEMNPQFRRYVLRELRARGPLRSRDLEDRAVVPWRSGGWNDGKNVGRMLDVLWFAGQIAVAARQGNERVWDLAERVLPCGTHGFPLPRSPGASWKANCEEEAWHVSISSDSPSTAGHPGGKVRSGRCVPGAGAGPRGRAGGDRGRVR
jgi:uncharacterized protein YcaQ